MAAPQDGDIHKVVDGFVYVEKRKKTHAGSHDNNPTLHPSQSHAGPRAAALLWRTRESKGAVN